jgi:hypothetical protein
MLIPKINIRGEESFDNGYFNNFDNDIINKLGKKFKLKISIDIFLNL